MQAHIGSACGNQFLVPTLLGNAGVINDNNSVCILDGGEPGSNYEGGSSYRKFT
jgi:hypothetical protein